MIKLESKKVNYTNKKGEEKTIYNFYINYNDTIKISIKPTFNNNYKDLVILSKLLNEKEGK